MAPIWKNMVEAGKTQVKTWWMEWKGREGKAERKIFSISDSLLRGLERPGEDR